MDCTFERRLEKGTGLGRGVASAYAESAKAAFAASPVQEFIIDGTERRIQRPSDPDRQKAYYSGKKKAHTDKNNLIIDSTARTVDYLSPL